MLVTEKEASEKWCPHAMVSAADYPTEGNHASNVNADGKHQMTCIGSRCMAWRSAADQGFCGLAGEA